MSPSRRLLTISAGTFLVLLFLLAAVLPFFSGWDPYVQDLDRRFLPPGTSGHIAGTDELGRDVWVRLLYGIKPMLSVTLTVVGISAFGGFLLGLSGTSSKRWVTALMSFLFDGMLSFPVVLLSIVIIAVWGPGEAQLSFALGFIFIPVFGRIVKAECMMLCREEWYIASLTMGSPLWKRVYLHIVPVIIPKLLIQMAMTAGLTIIIESSLSYLGLGIQPPNPGWGLMLRQAKNYLFSSPWLAVIPGIAIFLTVMSFNLLADGLRKIIDRT